MAKRGTGLAGELGIRRRDDPAAYSRAYRKANREKMNGWQNAYYHQVIKNDPELKAKKLEAGKWTRRKAKYGITKAGYEALLTKQGGVCAICGEAPRLNDLRVDHDHGTGKVRGLLCDSCNNGLGRFEDDPERLRSAAAYLERN